MLTLATDLDGTIYIEDKLIDQVQESHNELLKNIKIIYTTNNSSQNPLRVHNKLEKLLKTEIDIDSVVTPLRVLNDYLLNKNLKIYVYGSDDLTNYINKISKVTTSINDSDLILIGRKEINNEKIFLKLLTMLKKEKK